MATMRGFPIAAGECGPLLQKGKLCFFGLWTFIYVKIKYINYSTLQGVYYEYIQMQYLGKLYL